MRPKSSDRSLFLRSFRCWILMVLSTETTGARLLVVISIVVGRHHINACILLFTIPKRWSKSCMKREVWFYSSICTVTRENKTYSCMDATIRQSLKSAGSFLLFWVKWAKSFVSAQADLAFKNLRNLLLEWRCSRSLRIAQIFSLWNQRSQA